jgi:serine/threonine protein kinase
VFFGISDVLTGDLSARITSEQGIEDDDEFWRLASQLATGIADIHAKGVIHLAIEVRREWKTRRTLTALVDSHSPWRHIAAEYIH